MRVNLNENEIKEYEDLKEKFFNIGKLLKIYSFNVRPSYRDKHGLVIYKVAIELLETTTTEHGYKLPMGYIDYKKGSYNQINDYIKIFANTILEFWRNKGIIK